MLCWARFRTFPSTWWRMLALRPQEQTFPSIGKAFRVLLLQAASPGFWCLGRAIEPFPCVEVLQGRAFAWKLSVTGGIYITHGLRIEPLPRPPGAGLM